MSIHTYNPQHGGNAQVLDVVPALPDQASLPEGVTAPLVQVLKYETADHRRFDTVKDAEHNSMILSGKRRACPSCRGTGVNTGPDGRDHWTCTPCAGRGWQEHKSTWS